MPSQIPPPSADTQRWLQTGSLDEFEQIIMSPNLGLEFTTIDLVEIMERPDSDRVLRDLAILISERGVVKFCKQDRLTTEKQHEFIERLSKLSGRPEENGIMTHPLHAVYGDHPLVGSLTPERIMSRFGNLGGPSLLKRQTHANHWHRDMSWEVCPPSYSSLRMEQLPLAGGDTMYCSSYELYDRLSPPMQQFLSGLTCTWKDTDGERSTGKEGLYTGPRGSPHNVGFGNTVVHPAVRTHPITGFRALYAWGLYFLHFNDVTPEENQMLVDMIERLVTRNHDLQTRVTWKNPGEMAIWDNRAVMHSITLDVVGKRLGFRCMAAGERPYLDPKSVGRAEAAKSIKEEYDAKMEKIKKAGGDIEAQYENGKQVNAKGRYGTNVISQAELLRGLR